MSRKYLTSCFKPAVALLRRVAGDRSGNTFVIIAAAITPMLALLGGGIDIGRGYLAETRLQQACDAGVLAARKKLGSTIVTTGVIPTDVAAVGNRFFDINFQDGAFGTTGRSFAMTLGSDYAISGVANVTVPTTIMRLFGRVSVPLTATCSAQFNYANTDIMMVLDTTGSMNDKAVSTDPLNKIASLRQVVKDFYTKVEASKTQGVRIRYGFVPYSTNVNVGFLLQSGWMVSQAEYEGRTAVNTGLWWFPNWKWRYSTVPQDVSSLKGATDAALYKGGSITVKMGGSASSASNLTMTFSGCIEERGTYQISDYNNVDLTRARDLDIDSVPVKTNPETQWRPMFHDLAWLRAKTNSSGSWSPDPVDSSSDYMQASDYGYTACPARARKLAEMSATEVATYVNGLVPEGSTYHDIGMIWGGRLISPTGIFASENGDVNGRPTMRHLIFLTDGQTAPLDLSYGTYGVEPLSQRRWSSGSKYSLTQTVENRFTFACNQVRNKNITVWVIGFGTTVTDLFKDCAGSGHWFQANNSAQLATAFSTIAAAIGDLRIVK